MLKKSMTIKSSSNHQKNNSKDLENRKVYSQFYEEILSNKNSKCLRQSLNVIDKVQDEILTNVAHQMWSKELSQRFKNSYQKKSSLAFAPYLVEKKKDYGFEYGSNQDQPPPVVLDKSVNNIIKNFKGNKNNLRLLYNDRYDENSYSHEFSQSPSQNVKNDLQKSNQNQNKDIFPQKFDPNHQKINNKIDALKSNKNRKFKFKNKKIQNFYDPVKLDIQEENLYTDSINEELAENIEFLRKKKLQEYLKQKKNELILQQQQKKLRLMGRQFLKLSDDQMNLSYNSKKIAFDLAYKHHSPKKKKLNLQEISQSIDSKINRKIDIKRIFKDPKGKIYQIDNYNDNQLKKREIIQNLSIDLKQVKMEQPEQVSKETQNSQFSIQKSSVYSDDKNEIIEDYNDRLHLVDLLNQDSSLKRNKEIQDERIPNFQQIRLKGGVTLTHTYDDENSKKKQQYQKNDVRKSIVLSSISGGPYQSSLNQVKQSNYDSKQNQFLKDQNELSIFSQEPTDFENKQQFLSIMENTDQNKSVSRNYILPYISKKRSHHVNSNYENGQDQSESSANLSRKSMVQIKNKDRIFRSNDLKYQLFDDQVKVIRFDGDPYKFKSTKSYSNSGNNQQTTNFSTIIPNKSSKIYQTINYTRNSSNDFPQNIYQSTPNLQTVVKDSIILGPASNFFEINQSQNHHFQNHSMLDKSNKHVILEKNKNLLSQARFSSKKLALQIKNNIVISQKLSPKKQKQAFEIYR